MSWANCMSMITGFTEVVPGGKKTSRSHWTAEVDNHAHSAGWTLFSMESFFSSGQDSQLKWQFRASKWG